MGNYQPIENINIFTPACYFRFCTIFIVLIMTSSNGNVFRVTGPLWGESTGHRWIPLTTASDAERRCFLWSTSEETVEQTIDTPVIWDAIAFIMTSVYCKLLLPGNLFPCFSNQICDRPLCSINTVTSHECCGDSNHCNSIICLIVCSVWQQREYQSSAF